MNVEIFLENEGVIPKGFNWTELEQGIQRNIESFVEATEGKVVEVKSKIASERCPGRRSDHSMAHRSGHESEDGNCVLSDGLLRSERVDKRFT